MMKKEKAVAQDKWGAAGNNKNETGCFIQAKNDWQKKKAMLKQTKKTKDPPPFFFV